MCSIPVADIIYNNLKKSFYFSMDGPEDLIENSFIVVALVVATNALASGSGNVVPPNNFMYARSLPIHQRSNSSRVITSSARRKEFFMHLTC